MSIDDLRNDLDRNIETLEATTFAGFGDIKDFFKQTMFPLLENVVSELEELDSDISDLVEKSEDVLQPETAGIFAAVITQARKIADALEKRIPPSDANFAKWRASLGAFRQICVKAEEVLIAITVNIEEEEPDEDAADDDAAGEVEEKETANDNG